MELLNFLRLAFVKKFFVFLLLYFYIFYIFSMYFKKIPETIINTFVIPALLKQFDYVYTFMILNIYSALSKFMIRKRI
jgi:hypothetical protein